jgi:hypothetical protein
MKQTKFPILKLFLALLLIAAVPTIYKLWSVPRSKMAAPALVTLDQLVQNPGKYHKHYVVVTDAQVADPRFLMDRSFFWMRSAKTDAEVFTVSPVYRSEGEPSNNGIFYVELLYSGDTYQFILMREVNS